MSAGTEPTFNECIASVGKRLIYYTRADAYETIVCSLKFDMGTNEGTAGFSRFGFGASSTYAYYTQENSTINLSWTGGGFRFSTRMSSSVGENSVRIHMKGYSMNSIPTFQTTNSNVLADNSTAIVGSSNSYAEYVENTFYTNSPTYESNHVLQYNDNRCFPSCTILAPIKAGNVINANNIDIYAPMGYYIDVDNNIQLDPDIFLDYITNTLAPELELIYKQAYRDYPLPDVSIDDPDIDYINPFDDEEDETDELPDTTGGGVYYPPWTEETYILDTSSFDIDYGSAVQSPYDSLKAGAMLPENISSSVGTVFSQAFALIPPEFMAVYGFILLLSIVMWFIFRR